jgi:PAS domain S-box-containing protein
MAAEPGRSFDRLFDRALNPAFILDPLTDRIVDANQAACTMLGYTREELLATPVSRVHPAELRQLQALVERVARDGHGTTVALTCRTKLGEVLPTEISLSAYDCEDRLFLLALVHDRSEHRGRYPEE